MVLVNSGNLSSVNFVLITVTDWTKHPGGGGIKKAGTASKKTRSKTSRYSVRVSQLSWKKKQPYYMVDCYPSTPQKHHNVKHSHFDFKEISQDVVASESPRVKEAEEAVGFHCESKSKTSVTKEITSNKSLQVVYKKRATSAFFHIFPSLPLHFPNSCCKLHYSKEKMRLPKTLLMDTLILNLKPFVSESSKNVVPQNIFPKLL